MEMSQLASYTELHGFVSKIMYESNNFTIASLVGVKDQNGEPIPHEMLSPRFNSISIKGNFITNVDDPLSVKGSFTEDARYGLQFNVQTVIVDRVSPNGLKLFFESNKFTGIGERKAEQLATLLSERNPKNPLKELLELDDEFISEAIKLSLPNIKNLKELVSDDLEKENTLLALSEHISNQTMREAFYVEYKTNAPNVIISNPYKPIRKISGYTFAAADKIATKLGFKPNNKHRLNALITYIIDTHSHSTGDTIIAKTDLIDKMAEIGGSCSIEEYQIAIQNALDAQNIVTVEFNNMEYIQSHFMNQAELNVMTNVLNLVQNKLDVTNDELNKGISLSEEKRGITYDESQVEAIKLAASNHISIVTGGPGTGKTTTVDGIIDTITSIHHYKSSQIKRLAPTGRAASRLGNGAMTIHAFLNILPDDHRLELTKIDDIGSKWFDDKIKVIIIDEFSMVDTILATQLLSAIPENIHIIIVGDVNQLPSVAPGQVLSDLIASNVIPTIKLKFIHRQGEGSSISELANSIENGYFPDKFFGNTTNTTFTLSDSTTNSPQLVSQLIQYAINDTRFESDDIQTITPTNKGGHGVKDINDTVRYIQNPMWNMMNGVKKEITIGTNKIAVGDRVMNTKNCIMQATNSTNTLKNLITNGDIGVVTDIITDSKDKKEHTINVLINGEEYSFAHENWNQLTPAYAITVHKSQGGEFPLVMLNLTGANPHLVNRNLIYTAVTRASKMLCIIGDPEFIKRVVKKKGTNRKTYLQVLLS